MAFIRTMPVDEAMGELRAEALARRVATDDVTLGFYRLQLVLGN